MKVVKERIFLLVFEDVGFLFLCLILFFRERFNVPHLKPKSVSEFKRELGLQSL